MVLSRSVPPDARGPRSDPRTETHELLKKSSSPFQPWALATIDSRAPRRVSCDKISPWTTHGVPIGNGLAFHDPTRNRQSQEAWLSRTKSSVYALVNPTHHAERYAQGQSTAIYCGGIAGPVTERRRKKRGKGRRTTAWESLGKLSQTPHGHRQAFLQDPDKYLRHPSTGIPPSPNPKNRVTGGWLGCLVHRALLGKVKPQSIQSIRCGRNGRPFAIGFPSLFLLPFFRLQRTKGPRLHALNCVYVCIIVPSASVIIRRRSIPV
ncbi:hypothetical protein LZ30DRAFT_212127 [Colletotrichum cereale]|nr:hypothetical protein LZ30DRAFT_212127 [Colletotrichum cereale]